MKKYIIAVIVIVGVLVVGVNFRTPSIGGVARDTLTGKTSTHTAYVASSTASMAITSNTGRIALRVQNVGANDVYLYLQATSTGVAVDGGIKLASSTREVYIPNFIWPGEIWAITGAGTSTISIQEIK